MIAMQRSSARLRHSGTDDTVSGSCVLSGEGRPSSMSSAPDPIARVGSSTLTRNTLWMLVGQAVRTVVQAVYFVLVAHALQPAGYGAFVGALALVMIAAPFASVGAGNV